MCTAYTHIMSNREQHTPVIKQGVRVTSRHGGLDVFGTVFDGYRVEDGTHVTVVQWDGGLDVVPVDTGLLRVV